MKMLKCISIVLLGVLVLSCNSKAKKLDKINKDMAKTVLTLDTYNDETILAKKQNKVKPINTQDDWYWKNTVKSTNNIFKNWKNGAANIVMLHRLKGNESAPKTTKVGSIDSNGVISLSLPEKIETGTTLDNYGNLVFYDFQDIRKLSYKNGKTGYFSRTTLKVMKNGKTIGTITLGNSVRVTYNLTNQSTLTMGDEGYLLHWVFVDEAASMQGTETLMAKMRRDGTNTIEEQTEVVYDLNFKPGWNTVKTEIIGKYDLKHERGLNASWFKKHKHTVIAQIPSDADYFFRKLPN